MAFKALVFRRMLFFKRRNLVLCMAFEALFFCAISDMLFVSRDRYEFFSREHIQEGYNEQDHDEKNNILSHRFNLPEIQRYINNN
jgi:hypothetical protein